VLLLGRIADPGRWGGGGRRHFHPVAVALGKVDTAAARRAR